MRSVLQKALDVSSVSAIKLAAAANVASRVSQPSSFSTLAGPFSCASNRRIFERSFFSGGAKNGEKAEGKKEAEGENESVEQKETPEQKDNTAAQDEVKKELSKLQDENKKLVEKVKDFQERMLRLLDEQESIRARQAREMENTSKYAVSKFAKDLVDVADSLGFATQNIDEAKLENDEALKTIYEGVKMTEKTLIKAFEKVGVHKVDPVGELFDPQLHEALFEVEDPSKVRGTIVNVMQCGYVIHDRILRAAKVGTARGGPAPPAPAAPSK